MDNVKILLIILAFHLVGCGKEYVHEHASSDTYIHLLDNLNLDCSIDTSVNYFRGTVLNQDVCHYDGIDGRELHFGIYNRFTTSSPELSTGTVIEGIRRFAKFTIRLSPVVTGEEFVEIITPVYAIERDTLEYLDSLFSIEYHPVASAEEEDKFIIQLVFIDVINSEINGGLRFKISTIFGAQRESYVRFRKVKKTEEPDGIYYHIEMELQCNLYHWPQYGQYGLWSRIEDGVFVAKFRAIRK